LFQFFNPARRDRQSFSNVIENLLVAEFPKVRLLFSGISRPHRDYGTISDHGRSDLTRRNSLSRCDRKNSYPNHVHKRRRISSVKDRVYGQEKAADDIEKLESS